MLVEDHAATREGLAALLSSASGLSICGQFPTMEQALQQLELELPDVVLADIGLPGMSGVEGVRFIHQRYPALPILMLTVHDDDEMVFEAICSGACGYLLKETAAERLVQCIREVRAGGAPMSPQIARKVVTMFRNFNPQPPDVLSPRQLEILNLLAEGSSYKACADLLAVSTDTIRFHVRNIYSRLHVNSRAEAVAKAFGVRKLGPKR